VTELLNALPLLPSRQELRAVDLAWEAFMAGDSRGLEKVRPVIRESWRRSHRLGIDPHQNSFPAVLSAEDVEAMQERVDLVAVATPLFETILQTWEEQRFMLGVSDRHGRLLYTRGHPVVMERARLINAVPGSGMAEDHIGTAITNVVLAQQRTEYVFWSEHYCRPFHAWAALGAPVFHPLTREIIGVVGVGGEEFPNPRALNIIERMAGRLQQLLHHEELVRRVALLNAYHQFLLDHPRDIVVAVDGRGHICGASPNILELLEAPRQFLDTSLLRLPGVRVEGFSPLTHQQDLQPYTVRVMVEKKESIQDATVIPIGGGRQPAGALVVFSHAPAKSRRRDAAPSPWRATYTFNDLLGAAPCFLDCLTLARRAARTDFPVLLLGESGAGKELLAQAIHAASLRHAGPFVTVNCGALNDELLAAELFGYVEGAFTGAVKGGRKGKIELAHAGSLFLDEVEAMSPKMQVSLLRVLEERRIARVGGEHPIAVDARLIAASNEDLRAAVEQKRFRADLYHRLCVFPVQLPPLRERREDIPLLARHLLNQLGFPYLQLSPQAFQVLSRYDWPGNIRELKHVLLRAAHQTVGTTILPGALPDDLGSIEAVTSSPAVGSLKETERNRIVQALAEANHNLNQAAMLLGIHRTTLYRKLKKYGLAGETGNVGALTSVGL
jgi:transcriptional regulator of acetoin/glycerol metabolism